jgi:hypothetical protein
MIPNRAQVGYQREIGGARFGLENKALSAQNETRWVNRRPNF